MNSKIIPFARRSSATVSLMQEAIDTLVRLKIPFERPTEFQLKVGHWNFYPGRGTITCDGENAPEPERGLNTLLTLLGHNPADHPPKNRFK